MTRNLLLTLCLLLAGPTGLPAATYQAPEEYLNESFSGKTPEPAVVWLSGERRTAVEHILGHRYPTLRVRYWRTGQRSAWILEEVGKEQPITVGIIVDDGHIERIKVLIFRESRGWEIRHPFFTDQFKAAKLNPDRELDRHIDGISGATLSVRAMQKLARLALYLDGTTKERDVSSSP
jgi:hypothetical protein